MRRAGVVLVIAGCLPSSSSSSSRGDIDAGYPTLVEVSQQEAQASCEKLSDCEGAAFLQTNPRGVEGCVQSAVDGARAADPTGATRLKCTQSQVDQCVYDTIAAPCPDGGAWTAPASCIALASCPTL